MTKMSGNQVGRRTADGGKSKNNMSIPQWGGHNYICVYRSCKELVRPVFKACVEMWESKDKTSNQCL